MGCVSSNLLNNDDDFPQMGGSAGFGHHIVSLTSTTYGLLTTLDNPPSPLPSPTIAPTPPPRFTLMPSPHSIPRDQPSPEIINSWELMSGLDPITDSSRFFSRLSVTPVKENKENSHPNILNKSLTNLGNKLAIDGFEKLCPPNGENKVVIYTTSLRGVRKTFEDCNAVRAAIEGNGFMVCERDILMDVGFREELRELMKGKGKEELVPPRVFVKGRYIGGAEEVMKIVDETQGCLGDLLQGLSKLKVGYVYEGCGGARFLPCLTCNGSCKMVVVVTNKKEKGLLLPQQDGTAVVRCSDGNENGLVICSICYGCRHCVVTGLRSAIFAPPQTIFDWIPIKPTPVSHHRTPLHSAPSLYPLTASEPSLQSRLQSAQIW